MDGGRLTADRGGVRVARALQRVWTVLKAGRFISPRCPEAAFGIIEQRLVAIAADILCKLNTDIAVHI